VRGAFSQVASRKRNMDELSKNDDRIIDVAVGICLKGHTPPKAYHDRMLMSFCMGQRESEDKLNKVSPRFRFQWFFVGEVFVPFAREQLAQATLNYKCDYLFMVDDDMVVPFDTFYRLAANDKDICAALAFTRNPNHLPVAMITREGFDPASKRPYCFKDNIMAYPRDTLFQCDAVGFGAVLIKRKVIETMPKPWFMSTSPTGEDILFCNEARKCGFEVWMDSRIKTGHLGDSIIITEEYADNWNKLTHEERERKFGKYTFPTLEVARP